MLKLKVNTVFAASKFEQEILQAPASVSVISAEEIRNHGYRTLADILRSVRGFYVSYDRNYSADARAGDNLGVLQLVFAQVEDSETQDYMGIVQSTRGRLSTPVRDTAD